MKLIIILMTLVLIVSFETTRSQEECVIKSGKSTALEANAIGYSEQNSKVVIVELTLENSGEQPITLNWKESVPVLQSDGRHLEATFLLIPKWSPFSCSVGMAQSTLGNTLIHGFIGIDKDVMGLWLAIDKPGAEMGDHVMFPVKSATITVTKEKAVNIKFLFPEDIPLSRAQIVVPGCNPAPYILE